MLIVFPAGVQHGGQILEVSLGQAIGAVGCRGHFVGEAIVFGQGCEVGGKRIGQRPGGRRHRAFPMSPLDFAEGLLGVPRLVIGFGHVGLEQRFALAQIVLGLAAQLVAWPARFVPSSARRCSVPSTRTSSALATSRASCAARGAIFASRVLRLRMTI